MGNWSAANVAILTQLVKDGKTDGEIADRLSTSDCTFTENSVRSKRRRLKLPAKPQGRIKTFQERVEGEKNKLLTSQTELPTKAEIKRRAWQDLLLEMLATVITPLRCAVPSFKYPRVGKSGEEQVVLILSDLHFGKKTSKYDIEIALGRVKHLFESVIKIVSLHRNAYPIKVLNIIWNGDIVDGRAIYPTHPHHVDGNVMKQVVGVAPELATELVRLAGFFEQVNNYCVRGNHGRFAKDAHEDDNFDFIFYHFLAGFTKDIKNMSWDIGDGWFKVVQVLNTRILAVHGHQIKMTLNLPWYGITTRIARWAITEGVGGFDAAIISHFHTSSRIRWNNKLVFTNGTTVDGDEFALEVLGLESSQCQWLFGVHPDRKITWHYELDFN